MVDRDKTDLDAPKEPLDAPVKLFFGLLLPHCGLALIAYVCAPVGHDAAGGFAALGYAYGAWTLGGLSFLISLCIVSAITVRERVAAVMVGSIGPVIALLILLSGGR